MSSSQPLCVLPIVGGEVVLFPERLEVSWTRYRPVPRRMHRSFAIKELDDFKLFDTPPFVKGALRITPRLAAKEALIFLYSHQHDITAESMQRYLDDHLRDKDVLPIVRELAG
jgi:hypothetical protein